MQLARYMNAVLGTATITPWNLDDVPEVWVDVVIALASRQVEMAEKGLA